MQWLAIIPLLAALAAVHELVVAAVARAVGGEARRRRVYATVSGRRRVALAFAGGGVAMYVAIAALALSYACVEGQPTGRQWYAVGKVKADFPAAGKLEPGDRIDAVDGVPIDSKESLAARIDAKHGAPVTLSIVRAGRALDVTITPTKNLDNWVLGIIPDIERETTTAFSAAWPFALRFPGRQVAQLAHELDEQLLGKDTADPGGPKRIYEEFPHEEPFAALAWRQLLRLAVLLGLVLVVLDLVRAGRLVMLGSAA